MGAFLFVWAVPAASGITCPADRIDRRAAVDAIYDGDTVRLRDGTDVRLIGVDTPEIGRDGAPDEPHARDARRVLRQLTRDADRRLHLRLDADRRDDYGRLLAHAFLPDGRSIERLLLQRGLAARVTVPPNTWHHRCYARAEAEARSAQRRIWASARLRAIPAAALAPEAVGFHRVSGRIERVGESREAWWLALDGLTLRVRKSDWEYFEASAPERWRGRHLTVRGWIYRVDDRARMDLRHPASIDWEDASHE